MSYYSDDWLTILEGDCREVMASMEPESVHCVVTSPPYWGLRDYGIGEKGIGLEPTPEAYVESMVAVFREIRRVLRADGTVWLNLGDSYVAGQGGRQSAVGEMPAAPLYQGANPRKRTDVDTGSWGERDATAKMTPARGTTFLKPKDLVGIPWRVAFALQADGWYLRSDIIWAKPNPMPESVTDRPTKAHEYLFLLSKAPRYYYDADAVREKVGEPTRRNAEFRGDTPYKAGRSFDNDAIQFKGTSPAGDDSLAGRNLRSVWSIATQPYPGAHFATFPEKLVEPCILAGTSAKGVCPECGAPWVREVERGDSTREGPIGSGWREAGRRGEPDKVIRVGERPSATVGWRTSCDHRPPSDPGPAPATILDPFAGSGTVGRVAARLSRRAVLIDLNADYLGQAMKRNQDIPLGLETVG